MPGADSWCGAARLPHGRVLQCVVGVLRCRRQQPCRCRPHSPLQPGLPRNRPNPNLDSACGLPDTSPIHVPSPPHCFVRRGIPTQQCLHLPRGWLLRMLREERGADDGGWQPFKMVDGVRRGEWYTGSVQCAGMILKDEGPLAFWKGFTGSHPLIPHDPRPANPCCLIC